MRRRSEERGAVALFTAAIMVVILAIAALVVDIGMQRVARRDMQALADTVALDMARLLGSGRPRSEIESGFTPVGVTPSYVKLETAKLESTKRNASLVLGDAADLRVDVYLVALIDDATDVDTAKDNYATLAGVPVQVASSAVPTGVVVRTRTSVDFGFGGALGVSSGGANRSAVSSRSTPSVCFSVGTKALSLNTDKSALSPLLGGILDVNLSAVGYDGLVGLKSASIPLVGLLAQLNIGSTDALATTNVSLADFTAAAARAATANGDTASATLLEALKLGVPGLPINLGDILALQTGTPVAGLTSDVNLLDLLSAGIVAANGQTGVAVGVPNLANLTITEPPQIACGGKGTVAKSAQIRLDVQSNLAGLAGGLPSALVGGSLNLPVRVGAATATIAEDLTCLPDTVVMEVLTGAVDILSPQSPPVPPPFGQISVDVKSSEVLDGLGLVNRLLLAPILSGLGLSKITVDALVTGGVGAASDKQTILFPAPPGAPPTVIFPKGGVDKALNITGVTVRLGDNGGLVGLLGGLLNPVLGIVTGLVVPLVNTLDDLVLKPVINALLPIIGLRLGLAEVNMLGRPVCGGSKLIG